MNSNTQYINDIKQEYTYTLDFINNPNQSADITHQIIQESSKSTQKELLVLDTAMSINNLPAGYYQVKDHINLTNLSPLIGMKPVKFYTINNIYKTIDKLAAIKIAGINSELHFHTNSIKINNIDAYTCNSIPAILLAGYYELTIIHIVDILESI